MPLLSHCVVIGDDRKYLTMLVTLKCEVRIAGKKGKEGSWYSVVSRRDGYDIVSRIIEP